MQLDGPEHSNPPGRDRPVEQTLGSILARRRLSFSEIGRIGAQVADALARGHAQGDPHGAISPDCVMLDREGRARLVGPATQRLEEPYLSPEQVRGEPAGPATDVYALGLVLLEAATGHQVYPGNTPAAAEARLYHQPMVPNDVPGPLARALLAMTETDPASRPGAARSAEMLAGMPAAGAPVGAPIPPGPNWGRIAAIGLPIVLLLVLLGVLLTAHRDNSATDAAGSASSSATATPTGSETPTETPTGADTPTDTPTETATEAPTETSRSRSTGAGRPSLPNIALPTSLPKIETPKLPDLPSSGTIGDKVQSAWKEFTGWLSGLLAGK